LKEIIFEIGSEKVILLGHSWGSCLAINYLQNDPETIEKIIISGPGPILPIDYNVANEVPPDSLLIIEPEFSNKQGNEKANNWRSRFMSKWAYFFKSKLASDQEADDFFTHLNQELSKSTDCVLNKNRVIEGGGGYYSHIMTFNSIQNVKNKRDELKSVKMPILILRGQCDNQKWGFTKEYLNIFINSDLRIIKGAGHNIINSAQDQYYELIYNFLDEEPASNTR
jgi:proline iminopeptidase